MKKVMIAMSAAEKQEGRATFLSRPEIITAISRDYPQISLNTQ